MNEIIELYSWVRGTASIYLARIVQMRTQAGPPGQEEVVLQIKIQETLWGNPGELQRRCNFIRPKSELTRLKFPDPIWGRVALQEGVLILLVTPEISEILSDPLYVDEVNDIKDQSLNSIRTVLNSEQVEQNVNKRFARYLRWLTNEYMIQKLFAAEALAKDEDLLEFDKVEQTAIALATAFEADQDPFTCVSIGSWMWKNIYSRTTAQGKVAIINSTINCAGSASPDIHGFSLDQLTAIEPEYFQQAGVIKNPEIVSLMKEQLDMETSPEIRNRIQQGIVALQS